MALAPQIINDRMSMLPEIQPAEQPEDGDSSDHGFTEEVQSPIDLTGYNEDKPQSAFAKALANKKQNGENFIKSV